MSAAPKRQPDSLAYLFAKLQAMGLLLIGRSAAAEAVFSRMLREWPQDAYALASRAHVRAQAERHDEALRDAEALVAAHPARAAGDWFNLGFLREKAGQLEDAAAAFQRAVQMDPRLDRAWYGLGLALMRLGRLDEAAAALTQNTKLQPMSPYGWTQLARVHMNRQRPEEARKVILHLKRFEPQVAAALEKETGLMV
jgi:tetratricopeptide (TPR) repeat protein